MTEKDAAKDSTPSSEVEQAATASQPRQPKPKFDWTSLNALSVVSLASAISGVGALIAIITGHISLAQIKQSGENGRTMAVIGTALGYVSILVWVIVTLITVIASFEYGFEGGHMMDRRGGFSMDMDRD